MKKVITVLIMVSIFICALTGCAENSSLPTPTEDPLKSNYYTEIDGKQAYVMVGKLSHIQVSLKGWYGEWKYRDNFPEDEILGYRVVITLVNGEKFSYEFTKWIYKSSTLEMATKFTEREGYFRIYLTGPDGTFIKGPEWIE